jgi:hypothetical protein
MNDWQKLSEFIKDAGAQLPTEVDLSQKMTPAEVNEYEKKKTEDVDAAVHAFSTAGRWPLLSGEESFLIEQRLSFARLVALALATPDPFEPESGRSYFPPPPKDFSLDIQFQWLLVEAWNYAGRAAWHRRK